MDVRLERINKSFGAVQVLKDIDLVFPSRKFVTLLGPSGCGKTTLLRMIAGLEPVTSGTIRFGDRVVNELAPRDRNIAMVFQSYALYPQMTVRRNLGYGLRVRRTPKAEMDAAVERVAGILEIDHLLDRKPGAALRRPAPARGARPRHGAPARHLPDGRAAVEPRRQAARHHARRAAPLPSRSRRHHHLRHARPARGHDHVGHDRGHARRHRAAVRHAGRGLRPARQPVRRRLHRQPADELHRRHARRRAVRTFASPGLHAAASGCARKRAGSRGRAGGSAAGPHAGPASRSLRRRAAASGWWSCSDRRSWSRSHWASGAA